MEDQASSSTVPMKKAPVKKLPKTTYNTVEFPGPIPQNSASLQQAVNTLGRQKALDDCFNRATRLLELRYDPTDTWAHPIIGESVPVQRLLLKVVRRRRKIKNASNQQQVTGSSSAVDDTTMSLLQPPSVSTPADPAESSQGIFKTEMMGVVKTAVRFRAMADYRYTPDTTARIPRLIEALKYADPEALLDFDFKDTEGPRIVPVKPAALDPALTGVESREGSVLQDAPPSTPESAIEFKSTLPTLPPPMFSRQGAPHTFLYQPNPSSKPISYTHPITGEEYQRLINTNRAKTYAVRTIPYNEENVPDSPVDEIKLAAKKLDDGLMQKLRSMLETRPMWTRSALLNQFSTEEVKLLDSYQKVHFRITSRGTNGARVRFKRHIDADLAAELQSGGALARTPHIFDGKTLHKAEATYQLIDITDGLLYGLIREPIARRSNPDVNSGWYKQEALNVIKAIIRRKWLALSEDRICSDDDCLDLVEEFYSRKRSTATGDEVSHGGRPKGGGGYAAGDIPTNSTVQSTSKKDKWKRKATARLPATAEDLTVR
ncbi:hypothetical protein QFC22_000757 [Naganishia vaughanmartiniae]|uniref:Uncharacterized protein n=1 Tax=Naganishia vaughanmartiniae TaxID=1424756 RepID=A0ACC2XK00_9TREE|nr:hypothetical protein QFC22_000757 [Naganishia vaughanmartiniae]